MNNRGVVTLLSSRKTAEQTMVWVGWCGQGVGKNEEGGLDQGEREDWKMCSSKQTTRHLLSAPYLSSAGGKGISRGRKSEEGSIC